jgi:hypothetical protein
MDPVHLHLFLNHVPVVGGVGALVLLAWGLVRRSIDVTVIGLVALVVVALITVPVFLTGDDAEELVERLPGVSMEIAERHEDAALSAIIGIEATAAIALAALFVWRTTRRYPMFPTVAALVVGIAACVLIVRAAALGGQIRHSEIRAAAAGIEVSLK